MGKVTVCLNDRTEREARVAARAAGMSLSRWVTERIRRVARDEWPASIRKLAGAWPDLPPAEGIRESQLRDTPRRRG